MTSDLECIFCKIIEKKIPAAVIYEDPYVISFLDINPRFKGHALVIPKVHVSTLDELGDEALAHLFVVVKHVAKNLKETLGADGYNIISNNGSVAGQVVPHLHIHVVPRYADEKKGIGFEATFPVDEEAKNKLHEIAEKAKIKHEIKPAFRKDDKADTSEKEEKKDGKEENKEALPYESEYFEDNGVPKFR